MGISRILIANRGEIAVRVIRTARQMGIATVAVYSDADRGALHTQLADTAVHIGPAPAAESYLCIDKIIEAAHNSGADAIHPGYGFLSENADFARACTAARIIFIGPTAATIAAMGDKATAKEQMAGASVPVVPGYAEVSADDAALREEASHIGFPLLVKATCGGGGRGMRRVTCADDLPDALTAARREAKKFFGDDRLMLERFVEAGRHIEVQIFGDSQGNIVHLGERDCTAQRRRQKIIEETPSPTISAALRDKLTGAAIAAGRATDYLGAGTVEFIVDQDDQPYFLEMNTRLQVEHPVTEMVTGVDLVAWQITVAAGQPLPLTQEHISFEGHAIEARLYAEDPYRDFAPQTGTLKVFAPSGETPGIRIDSGVRTGDIVSPHYDPMIAKIVARGTTRDQAISKLRGALRSTQLFGLKTNQQFLVDLLASDAFAQSTINTGTIDQWRQTNTKILDAPEPSAALWALAAALLTRQDQPWFRSSGVVELEHRLLCDELSQTVNLRRDRDGTITVSQAGTQTQLVIDGLTEDVVDYTRAGVARRAYCHRSGRQLFIDDGSGTFSFSNAPNEPSDETVDDPDRVIAPVTGNVQQVLVEVGAAVTAGDTLAIVEAMKMETRLTAPRDGVIADVQIAANAQVRAGATAMIFEALTS